MAPAASNQQALTLPDLEIWLVSLDEGGGGINACAQRLGLPTEPPRRDSDATAGDQHRETAYLALRILLYRHLGTEVARQPLVRERTGRPYLEGKALHFSLSHSGGRALIAFSRAAPIGVDLELPRTLRMSGPRRTAIEDAGIAIARGRPLAGDAPDARTLMAWVRIEAAAKATGEGIGAILARLDARPGRVIPVPEGPTWPVSFDLALPDPCHGAVAVFPGHPMNPGDLIVRALDADALCVDRT